MKISDFFELTCIFNFSFIFWFSWWINLIIIFFLFLWGSCSRIWLNLTEQGVTYTRKHCSGLGSSRWSNFSSFSNECAFLSMGTDGRNTLISFFSDVTQTFWCSGSSIWQNWCNTSILYGFSNARILSFLLCLLSSPWSVFSSTSCDVWGVFLCFPGDIW